MLSEVQLEIWNAIAKQFQPTKSKFGSDFGAQEVCKRHGQDILAFLEKLQIGDIKDHIEYIKLESMELTMGLLHEGSVSLYVNQHLLLTFLLQRFLPTPTESCKLQIAKLIA